jgi:hypothetical protein
MWIMLATLYCKSTKLSEQSLHPIYFRTLEVEGDVCSTLPHRQFSQREGVGLERTKTAEYMMFQHVSNILLFFLLFRKVKKRFPFETLLPVTMVCYPC